MLTISQPAHYGYRSVHDLPTPPSTSRNSPPLIFQEVRKPLPAIPRRRSPPTQPMSAPHRGLPPPAAMALSQPSLQSSGPPPPSLPPPPSGPSSGQSQPPPQPQQAQAYAQFPAAPSWQHVSEESMRAYLAAKAEEEKRRQEEEKTRQATLRLEQRRMEHDILQASLQGGIPPPMVPVVFAGMGGGVLPQAAIEWAHQYVYAQSQQSHAPALLPPGQISASPRRDSQAQAYGPYAGSAGVPSTPGSAQGPPSGYMSTYPGSPTRPRGQSMSGLWPSRQPPAAGQNLPSLNTAFPGRAGGDAPPTHPGVASAQQQEPQPSPSIYFHHWQPPTGQSSGRGSGTDQPGAPSGSSKNKPKAKRKSSA
ncbi:hypothetical protein BR93DRAFT_653150 [Coniochaeta sp. PMI_546]|nr:hypothetical protein BR93DRAFT_653150 [Coniochaeta sp. PMI_546]